MNFGQCKSCNKSIKYNKIPVCTECLNNYFIKVRDYIYVNGMKTADQLKEATGVPVKVINYFIEQGSLLEENGKLPEIEEEEKNQKLRMINDLRNMIRQDNNSDNSVKVKTQTKKDGMFYANKNWGK